MKKKRASKRRGMEAAAHRTSALFLSLRPEAEPSDFSEEL
jgi:hypothetical protein